MKLPIYQVDAFASAVFNGNPAAVCPLEKWLSDEIMQQIAAENNLSETAFFFREENNFHIRWFTPNKEVDLCGHATLASAHVIFKHLDYGQRSITFTSKSGKLIVEKNGEELTMNFPADSLSEYVPTNTLLKALGVRPVKVLQGVSDILVIVRSQAEVEALQPDFRLLGSIPVRGIIVSAPGTEKDFVSRCFYPAYAVDEDPVTGSAHTTLTSYWSVQLNKSKLTAQQLSRRSGELVCEMKNDRVFLTGKAITYLEGFLHVN